MSATANFVGALTGTAVAKTIASGIVDIRPTRDQVVVAAALVGAIIWNLITWRFGIPSSQQPRADRRAARGADRRRPASDAVNWDGVFDKVLVPLVASPILGFIVGFLAHGRAAERVPRAHPQRLNDRFRRLQLVSAGYMAFSHGSNDAQKTMGIITLALFAAGRHRRVRGAAAG